MAMQQDNFKRKVTDLMWEGCQNFRFVTGANGRKLRLTYDLPDGRRRDMLVVKADYAGHYMPQYNYWLNEIILDGLQ